MYTQIKNIARSLLPDWAKAIVFYGSALLMYPKNRITYLKAQRDRETFYTNPEALQDSVFRIFEYNHSLLPNPYIARLESESHDFESAIPKTAHTVGYPSWNLLYYALLCSLPPNNQEVIVVETGTNYGFSAIILAQALKDMNRRGIVRTVDIDENLVRIAKRNVENAGLLEYVEFHVQDSRTYLSRVVKEVDHIHFAFLDSYHEDQHVRKEFSLIYPRIVACRGKVYFDNTVSGGVARALRFIKYAYGGNFIEFTNCSCAPPGNVIWQPD